MTLQRKFEILGVAVLLIAAAIFLKLWIAEREADIRAQDQAAASKQILDATNAAISSRDQAAAATVQQLNQQAAAVQTPQQAAQVILRYLPQPAATNGAPAALPASIPTVQAQDLTAQGEKDLPDAPGSSLLTPIQLEDIAKQDLACQANDALLNACTADRTDLRTQIAALQKQSDAWESAARGGTKMQRFVHILKLAACSAGASFVGAYVDKAHPDQGAAIGSAGGIAACSLF